jgi:O-antigen ligase
MQKTFNVVNKEINKLARVDILFLFLIGLLILLPILETLKNIFAFLFVVSWVVIAKKNNDWGGKWLIVDSIFLLWILADIFVSINAIITHQLSGEGVRDIIRFVLIAWVLSRTNFSKERLTQSALVAVVAVIVALIHSYYAGHGRWPELYSVGHINHNAIYLVITYAISLALLLFNYNNLNSYQKITLVVTTIALFITIIVTGSRAAFGLLIIITLLDFLYLLIRVKKLSLLFGFLAVATCIGISMMQNPPVALQRILAQEHIIDDEARVKIREFSYYAFKTNPLLGVGFKNYGQITMEDIRDAVLKEKEVFENNSYLPGSHAHNVYYTYLVSGGLLIFSIFAWFWFYIVRVIIKLITRRENEWIVLSSIGVVLVNLGIGLVNTTFHHEHAVLSMFVLGLLIAQFRKSELIKELAG